MVTEGQLYKFKWGNETLSGYIKGRLSVAKKMRRDAEVLVKQAETIEAEADELERSLLPAPHQAAPDA